MLASHPAKGRVVAVCTRQWMNFRLFCKPGLKRYSHPTESVMLPPMLLSCHCTTSSAVLDPCCFQLPRFGSTQYTRGISRQPTSHDFITLGGWLRYSYYPQTWLIPHLLRTFFLNYETMKPNTRWNKTSYKPNSFHIIAHHDSGV